jgi:hypothetical protein
MEAKLIKKDGHYFLSVDYWYPNHIRPSIVANTFVKPKGDVYELSRQNCDEIFGVVDVDKLAKQEAEKLHDKSKHEDCDIYNCLVDEDAEMIKIGFNKATELNGFRKFTLSDMKRAFNCGRDLESIDRFEDWRAFTHFINSLEPTEIEVEIEMRTASLVYKTDEMLPKLDEDGCLILKKL